MASPLRVSEVHDEAELEARAKEFVLKHVSEKGPIAPGVLYEAVRTALNAPFSLAQLAMWDLVAHGAIVFTEDYRLQVRR